MAGQAGPVPIGEERVSRRHLLRRLVARAVDAWPRRQSGPETLPVPYVPYTTRPEEEGP